MADLTNTGFRRTGRNNLSNQPDFTFDPETNSYILPEVRVKPGRINSNPKSGLSAKGPRTTTPPKQLIDATAGAASSINVLNYPDSTMKYFFQMGIGEYVGFSGIGGGAGGLPGGFGDPRSSTNIDTFIKLPMPELIVDQQTADWTDANLLQETLSAAGGLIAARTAFTAGQSVSAAAGTIGAAVLASTAGTVAGIAARLGGVAPNQFITILFSGPKYKQHSFTWNFSPKTPEEAEELRKILQILNNRQAPGMSRLTNWLWSFPSVFWLKFCPDVGSFKHTYMYEFKPAVLVNMAIDYAGAHPPAFRRKDDKTSGKNPPQAIRLTMQFIEIEYWVNGDYGDATSEGATANKRIPSIPLREGLNNS